RAFTTGWAEAIEPSVTSGNPSTSSPESETTRILICALQAEIVANNQSNSQRNRRRWLAAVIARLERRQCGTTTAVPAPTVGMHLWIVMNGSWFVSGNFSYSARAGHTMVSSTVKKRNLSRSLSAFNRSTFFIQALAIFAAGLAHAAEMELTLQTR